MVLLRALAAVSMVAFVSLSAAGCSSGLSKEEADVRCDQDKAALSANYNDDVYKQCEACYMECGDNCVRQATSPITYQCVESAGSGGASTSSTTGSTTASQ